MKQSQSGKRSYFGFVFGMVFVIAGAGAFYFSAGKMMFAHIQSVGWQSVPASIVELRLDRREGSESTTYIVEGRYSYWFNGQEYVSDRISTSFGADNFGSYWQDLYADLQQQRALDSVRAWVNPDKPAQAVLDRSFRWSVIGFASIFLVMFGGLGGLFAWFSWKKQRPEQEQQREAAHAGGIPSNEKNGGWFLVAFGFLFFFFGGVMSAMMLPEELAKKNYAALVVLVFVLVGLGIMTAGVNSMRAYRRFGPTPLTLDPSEPGLGGVFGAKFNLVCLSHTHVPDLPFHTQLSCFREYRSKDNTHRKVIWSDEREAYCAQSAQGLVVIALFDIPETEQATQNFAARDKIKWEFSANADLSALGLGKFDRSWNVFIAEQPTVRESSLHIPERVLRAAQQEASKRALQSALAQIELNNSGGVMELYSAAGRGFLLSLIGVIFGAVFAGVGWFTVHRDWWPGYFFLLIGGGIAAASIFAMGSSVRARIDTLSRSVSVTRRWFGLPFASKQAPLTDATQFVVKSNMSTSSGRKRVEYCDLYLNSSDSKLKLAERIKGRKAADALKAQLVNQLF